MMMSIIQINHQVEGDKIYQGWGLQLLIKCKIVGLMFGRDTLNCHNFSFMINHSSGVNIRKTGFILM